MTLVELKYTCLSQRHQHLVMCAVWLHGRLLSDSISASFWNCGMPENTFYVCWTWYTCFLLSSFISIYFGDYKMSLCVCVRVSFIHSFNQPFMILCLFSELLIKVSDILTYDTLYARRYLTCITIYIQFR